MNEDDSNIIVITKEQAMELIDKAKFNQENLSPVKFSTILLLSIVIMVLAIVVPILLIVLAPVFFIEYVIKKFFEKRENMSDENSNTSS